MKLRIHRLAVVEIDHAVDYYESCRAGLGVELEDEIDAVIETILQFPGRLLGRRRIITAHARSGLAGHQPLGARRPETRVRRKYRTLAGYQLGVARRLGRFLRRRA